MTAAQRYIPERRLPDSAIDVIDEAAARARLHSAAAAAALAAAQAAEAAALEAAVAGTGDPPLDAAGQSFAETQRLMEWLSAEQKQQQPAGQAQVQAAAATYPAPAQLYSGAAGLSASATHALSCPHCGTPASPPEGAGAAGMVCSAAWLVCIGHVLAGWTQLPQSLSCLPLPAALPAVTVTCARCRFKFLSIPQEKLLLGASLFTPQQRRRQQQLLQRALGLPLAAAAAPAAAAAVAAAPAAAPEAEAEAAAASGPAGASAAPAATVATPATATLSAAAPAGPPVIDAADILAVVAEASGIPAEHLSQTDWQPLADLEGRLRQRVVGQDAAVAAAAGAVRLGRLGLQRGAKPLASLLLTGPAGVGKGTLCAALAEALFGSGRHLLRFNLAEFADRASGESCGVKLNFEFCFGAGGSLSRPAGPPLLIDPPGVPGPTPAVSRLVGAPPGYVGYGDGGLLSEGIR